MEKYIVKLTQEERETLYETFAPSEAKRILDKLEIHYTPAVEARALCFAITPELGPTLTALRYFAVSAHYCAIVMAATLFFQVAARKCYRYLLYKLRGAGNRSVAISNGTIVS